MGDRREGRRGQRCGGMGVLTFGLQLLLLLSPPCVVIIFCQLFGHGLEVGRSESRVICRRPLSFPSRKSVALPAAPGTM